MLRTLLISSSALALLTAVPAFAQEAPDPDVAGRAGASGVDAVVVTATRSPQNIDKIGQSITVLDPPAIQAAQSTAVVDLLTSTPGVSYTRNGGVGTTTGVNIRGAESQHTVVLIDGVKLNDPSSTQGGFNFGNLLVGDVARIEVLRGAQSTLWGSQAIGGVVNIVTAEPTRPFQADVTAEGGSRGTGYLRAGIGGASDRIVWRLAGGYYQTDGFSAFKKGTEDDGYRNTGLSGRVRVNVTDDVSVDARVVYSKGRNDFDAFNGDSPEYGRTEELVAYTGVNFGLFNGKLKNRIAFAYTDTDRENYNPATPATPMTFDAAGTNRRLEYQGTLALGSRWNLVFGLESEDAKMRTRSPSSFNPNPAFVRGKAGIDSLYVQAQGEVVTGLTLTGGVRFDDHDTYGSHTTGQFAAAWALNQGDTVLRASWGQGFRAPGLYELYSEYGNTALSPEEFNSWDTGVEQRLFDGKVVLSATYFNRKADNEIRFYSCGFPTDPDPMCNVGGVSRFGYYRNVAKTQTQGIELTGEAHLGDRFTLSGNYTWTDAQNKSPGPNDGKQLTRRPEHMGSLTASYVWPVKLTTAVQVRYVGKTFNNESNTVAVSDYTLVDLRASYPINDTLEVYGRVENVFDEDYQTVLNYGTAGRGGFIGVRAKF